MTAFEVGQIFNAQGAKKSDTALVLESLHNGKLLPTWGPGETGAAVSARDVVSIIIGSTAFCPENAAAHCIEVASLIRDDGKSFGEILTKVMTSEPCTIGIDEITVSADSNTATIRYSSGNVETYSISKSNML